MRRFVVSLSSRRNSAQSTAKVTLTCTYHSLMSKSSSQPVDLVVNRAIQSQIEELAIYCRYGLKRSESDSNFVVDDEGCCETVRFGRRDEHESVCPHAFVPCPLGGVALCGFIRRRDIDEHVAQCRRVRCPYSTSGMIIYFLIH